MAAQKPSNLDLFQSRADALPSLLSAVPLPLPPPSPARPRSTLVVFSPPHAVRDAPTLSTAHATHAHALTPRRAPSCHTLPAWPAAAC
ncbi:hypothetical protein VTO73DRAFT_7917 [Trametes versicolor]